MHLTMIKLVKITVIYFVSIQILSMTYQVLYFLCTYNLKIRYILEENPTNDEIVKLSVPQDISIEFWIAKNCTLQILKHWIHNEGS